MARGIKARAACKVKWEVCDEILSGSLKVFSVKMVDGSERIFIKLFGGELCEASGKQLAESIRKNSRNVASPKSRSRAQILFFNPEGYQVTLTGFTKNIKRKTFSKDARKTGDQLRCCGKWRTRFSQIIFDQLSYTEVV